MLAIKVILYKMTNEIVLKVYALAITAMKIVKLCIILLYVWFWLEIIKGTYIEVLIACLD